MKYRCLTYQEFEVLEADFSDFLHDQGFNYYEWKVLQDQDSYVASTLLKEYSDLTFDKVMREIDCLQFRTTKTIRTIYFKVNHYVEIDVIKENNSSLDFTQPSSQDLFDKNIFEPFRIKKSIHHYEGVREEKIFNLIENGYYVVPKDTFLHINNLRKIQQN